MRVLLTSLVIIALPSLAAAASLPPGGDYASPLPVASWAGLYAGSSFGVGLGDFRMGQTVSRSASSFGVSTGALIGYNFQSGPIVYGVEGDIGLNVLGATNQGVSPGLVATKAYTVDTSHIRARLGYDFGQFLPFIAGGLAFDEAHVANSPNDQFGQMRSQTGLTIGAGVDWKIDAPFIGPAILRGEYLYDDFPERSYAIQGGSVRTHIATQFLRLSLIVRPGETGDFAGADIRASDWAGSYAGLIGGELWATPRTSLGGVATSYNARGQTFGIFTGHNFMFGSWMLGVEGATTLSNASGSGAQPLAPTTHFRNYFESDLRGRAGYAFGAYLPFVAAGLDWSESEQTDAATGSEEGRVSDIALTVGGGLEYMFAPHWSARAEYLLANSLAAHSVGLDGFASSQTRRAQQVRFGIAYHFN